MLKKKLIAPLTQSPFFILFFTVSTPCVYTITDRLLRNGERSLVDSGGKIYYLYDFEINNDDVLQYRLVSSDPSKPIKLLVKDVTNTDVSITNLRYWMP